jgi:hypothetical protein
VNFVGMGLAGVGGMLVGLDTSIDPLSLERSPEGLRMGFMSPMISQLKLCRPGS